MKVPDALKTLCYQFDMIESQQPSRKQDWSQAQHNFFVDSFTDFLLKSSFYVPTNLCLTDFYYAAATSYDDPFTTAMTAPASSHSTVRLRGGSPELLTQFDGNLFSVASLDQKHFRWNGLPSVEFNENIIAPFRAGLMQVGDKHATVWQTANRVDPGGTRGNPAAAALNPAIPADALIIAEHNLRVMKLFGIICNYTFSGSETYKMFMRMYNSDGVAVWEFIVSYGPLPVPQRFIRAREDQWKELTYDKLKLPYSVTGYFKYLDTILRLARKLGLDCNKQKEKFITGLPAFMQKSQSSMRHSSYPFPANYNGLPRFATAPFAANAHPDAGNENVDALARAFLIDFFEQASSLQGVTSDGIVNLALSTEDAIDMVNALDAARVTPRMRCHYCGGIGHATSVLLPGGKVLECPAKVLGHPAINRDELKQANEINSEPDSHLIDDMGAAINELVEQVSYMGEQIAALKPFNKRFPRKGSPSRPNVANMTSEDEDDVESEGTEAEDMTAISAMANSVKPKSRFQPSKHRPK